MDARTARALEQLERDRRARDQRKQQRAGCLHLRAAPVDDRGYLCLDCGQVLPTA